MGLQKGMRVTELTKKVGQTARSGTILDIHGHSAEVRWDDGRVSSLSNGLLFELPEKKKTS
jgi:hypothetical protein